MAQIGRAAAVDRCTPGESAGQIRGYNAVSIDAIRAVGPRGGAALERAISRSVVASRVRSGHHSLVTTLTRELLTTGQAAILLRSSRAHVVDLCLRGLLPYVRVNGLRRIRRADVEALIEPGLSRDAMESLWLHRAVAGKIVQNPAAL